jgi:hypothetical protein
VAPWLAVAAEPQVIDGFEALAKALVWLEAAFERVRAANRDTYRPGSPAALEVAAAGTWDGRTVRNAHIDGLLPMFSASDHLVTLADVLRSKHGFFASYTIGRGAIEAAAKTWYLLEPDIGPKERSRRRMNDRLESLYSQVLVVEGLGEDATAQRRDIDEILGTASRQGFFVKPGKRFKSPYVHEEQPTRMALLEQMMSDAAEDGIEVGGSTYRVLSGVAHSTSYGLVQMIEPVGRASEPGVAEGRVRQSSATTAAHLLAVPLAYALAVDRVITDYGWDAPGWRDPMVAALTRWRDHAASA